MIKKLGNRKDAKRCLDVKGMNQILIDLKPHRYQSELYINQKIDVTNLVKYLEKQKEKHETLTYFHAFSYIIGKVLYLRPLLNRFISNRHTYEHNNITLSFVMKTEFQDKAEEVMVLVPVMENDTLFTLGDRIKSKVDSIRRYENRGKGANNAIHLLAKLPNIIRIPVVGVLKWSDKHGLLPSSLIKENIYYSSMIISNVGTFKSNGLYHNVTDFGTCSGLITIGKIQEEKNQDLKEEAKYYCEFGITIDERIADGFYFIKSIQLMEYLINNPKLLEDKISSVVNLEKSKKNGKEK